MICRWATKCSETTNRQIYFAVSYPRYSPAHWAAWRYWRVISRWSVVTLGWC